MERQRHGGPEVITELWKESLPWLQLLSLVGAVVQCLGVWALWSLTRKFVTREDCLACRKACQKEVSERLAKQEASSGELLGKVAQAPTKDEVKAVDKDSGAMRADIEALTATVQGMGEAMKGMARQLNLLFEHHLGRPRS